MKRMILSSGRVNRYGFRLLPEGAIIEDYENNPVLLWNHDGYRMSVGKVKDIRVEDGKLTGEPEFDLEDEQGKELARKYEKGYQVGCSIWYDPVDVSEDPELLEKGQTHATVTKWHLLEVSMVNVQGDAGAHKLSREKEHNMGITIPELLMTKEDYMSLEKINKKLGLSADAQETATIEAIDQLKTQLAAAQEQRIDNLLKRGKTLGIIDESNEEKWRKLALSDADTVNELLDQQPEATQGEGDTKKLSGDRTSLLSLLEKAATVSGDADKDDPDMLSFDELSQKDSVRLNKIRRKNPELYTSMVENREKKFDVSQKNDK